jgi:hypothetical protein
MVTSKYNILPNFCNICENLKLLKHVYNKGHKLRMHLLHIQCHSKDFLHCQLIIIMRLLIIFDFYLNQ